MTVQPVLDLAEHIQVGSYEASARLKLQTQLRDGTCAFAFCFRPAEDCDCEHRVPADPDRADGGPTCTCNLAPCCRRHHRAKTTGGWTYMTVEPGVYLWRSPLGYQFLRDATGTLDVTPDEERLRLAREFRAHFGDPNPDHPAPHPAQHHASGEFGALSAATRRVPAGSVSGQTRSRCPVGGSHQRLPTFGDGRGVALPWSAARRAPRRGVAQEGTALLVVALPTPPSIGSVRGGEVS